MKIYVILQQDYTERESFAEHKVVFGSNSDDETQWRLAQLNGEGDHNYNYYIVEVEV